jgi:hypothetical protein
MSQAVQNKLSRLVTRFAGFLDDLTLLGTFRDPSLVASAGNWISHRGLDPYLPWTIGLGLFASQASAVCAQSVPGEHPRGSHDAARVGD